MSLSSRERRRVALALVSVAINLLRVQLCNLQADRLMEQSVRFPSGGDRRRVALALVPVASYLLHLQLCRRIEW